MLISVIIPAFNEAQYIGETLASVLQQRLTLVRENVALSQNAAPLRCWLCR